MAGSSSFESEVDDGPELDVAERADQLSDQYLQVRALATHNGMLPAGQQATSPALRLQVVLHASGLALVLVVGVVLWNLWSLLAAFRDAMLWALLCSIALRDAKDFLVQQLDRQLQQPRCAVCLLQSEPASTVSLSTMSVLTRCPHRAPTAPACQSGKPSRSFSCVLPVCGRQAAGPAAAAHGAHKHSARHPAAPRLSPPASCCRSLPVTTLLVVLLPLHTVVDTVNDIWRWLKRWRRYALDYEQATQDRQGAAATLRGELHAGAGRAKPPPAGPQDAPPAAASRTEARDVTPEASIAGDQCPVSDRH